jgi:hypothetical protein
VPKAYQGLHYVVLVSVSLYVTGVNCDKIELLLNENFSKSSSLQLIPPKSHPSSFRPYIVI